MRGPTRRSALITWWVLALSVVIVAAVATAAGPQCWQRNRDVAGLFAWVALGMALLCLLLSRWLPGRSIALRADRNAVAYQRTIVALVMNEGAALFAGVAWMLGGRILAITAVAISGLGLILAYPSVSRWQRLCEDPGSSDGLRDGAGAPQLALP